MKIYGVDSYEFYKRVGFEAKASASENCKQQLDEYWRGFSNGELWAWNMVDATSKIPSGLLTGNNIDLGNYDQCLAVDHDGEIPVKGKYCLGGMITVVPIPFQFSINSTSSSLLSNISVSTNIIESLSSSKIFSEFRSNTFSSRDTRLVVYALGLCIPNQCAPSEMNLPLAIVTVDTVCQIKEETKLEVGDYFGVAFFLLILLFMVVSTIYDVYVSSNSLGSSHPLLLAFSVRTNGRKLLQLSHNPRNLTCFGGLRFLSMLWVIMGHRFSISEQLFSLNKNDMQTWRESLYSIYIQAAQYAVDTFLVLGGCLVSYGSLIPMKKLKSRMDHMNTVGKLRTITTTALSSWLTRYLRIAPSLLAVFVCYVTFLRYLGSGPIWSPFMDGAKETCLQNWWSVFLFVENYVHTDKMCLSIAWYLYVDMQLYILSPILLWLLIYLPKLTLYMIIPLLTVASMVFTGIVCYIYDIQWDSDDFYQMYYYLTHSRASSWLVGFLFGAFLCEYKDKRLNINKLVTIALWIVALVGSTVLFVYYHETSYNYDRLISAIWIPLNRPVWAIIVCWIIFACVKGYGGIINAILSLPAFQILGRLTFCMYLVHVIPIAIESMQIRVVWYFSDFNAFYKTLSDVMLTIFVAIFWVLAFESPMISVERILTGRSGIRKEKENLINSVEEGRRISAKEQGETSRES